MANLTQENLELMATYFRAHGYDAALFFDENDPPLFRQLEIMLEGEEAHVDEAGMPTLDENFYITILAAGSRALIGDIRAPGQETYDVEKIIKQVAAEAGVDLTVAKYTPNAQDNRNSIRQGMEEIKKAYEELGYKAELRFGYLIDENDGSKPTFIAADDFRQDNERDEFVLYKGGEEVARVCDHGADISVVRELNVTPPNLEVSSELPSSLGANWYVSIDATDGFVSVGELRQPGQDYGAPYKELDRILEEKAIPIQFEMVP